MLDISFSYKKLQFSLCGDTKNKTSTEHESETGLHNHLMIIFQYFKPSIPFLFPSKAYEKKGSAMAMIND